MSVRYRHDPTAHPLKMPGVLDGPQSSFEAPPGVGAEAPHRLLHEEGALVREQVPHHARAAQHELHEAVLVVLRRVHRRAVPCLAYPPGTIGLREQPQ